MYLWYGCNRHNNETVTLRKYVSKYKNMQKWMVEFFRKFENRSIKIARVNSILITKSINLQLFTLIFYGFRVSYDLTRLSVLSPFIEKSMFHRIILLISVTIVYLFIYLFISGNYYLLLRLLCCLVVFWGNIIKKTCFRQLYI